MDLTVGQLIPLPTPFAPEGTLACIGQLVAIEEYSELFMIIGNTFGGDGINTFGIPNVLPLIPLNGPPIYWYMAAYGIYGGTSAVQLLAQVSPLVLAPQAGTQLAQDTVPCNGSIANINETGDSQAIFSLIGDQFGGDGISTFAYPNIAPMQGVSGQSFPYYMAVDGYYLEGSCSANNPAGDYMFLSMITMLPYTKSALNGVCGMVPCRGQTLPLGGDGQWDNLYSILGTRYGGDGRNTFALPALRDVPGGFTYMMVTAGVYPSES